MTSPPSNQLPPGVSPNHPLGPLKGLIDDLRTCIKDTTENGESDDLGVCTITAGDSSDALVPVFFRCTWPAGAKSRHQLIWMKPSIPDEAFGTAVNNAFRVIEAGGIIRTTRVVWGNVNPFAHPSADGMAARDTVRRAVGLGHPPTQQQIIKMMEVTMNGVMQVLVEPARDAAKCSICGRSRPLTPKDMDYMRKSAFGPMIFCEDCVQKHGRREIDRIHDQEDADAKQRAQNSLSNPSE
ncbi:MAG: hypothetical protein Q9175_008301 [Cornicularia normoerica]